MALPAPDTAPRIDFPRLQADIEALAQIGRGEDGGLYRMAFGEADFAARRWMQERLAEAGIEAGMDGAGNVFGRLRCDGRAPSILVGSHLDTVPRGGALDGALGVCVGMECLRRLRELDLEPDVPFECVAFSDEEGRFGGMFGSAALCGALTPDDIRSAVDRDGVRLADAMVERGLDPLRALTARRRPETVRAYLELHIEQGPVLDRRGISIGVVEAICGLFKWNVRLIGAANHAGTTPMDMRQDAFQGLAEFGGEIQRLLEEHGSPRSVATVGSVTLVPGAANVVPGEAQFSLEVRDTDATVLAALEDAMRRTLSAIARRRQLMFEFEVVSQIAPASCDPGVAASVRRAAEELGVEALSLPSGAAHDAQLMAGLTRSGMIFVPSKDGRSHSPAEWTDWHDIEVGANVALLTLLRLAAS